MAKRDADGLTKSERAGLSLTMLKFAASGKIPADKGAKLARDVLKPSKPTKQ
jgi:hypothetical protein